MMILTVSLFDGENLQDLLHQVGGNRCALSYRRCETTVDKMLEMINVELEQIEGIQKEVDAGIISVEDIQNR